MVKHAIGLGKSSQKKYKIKMDENEREGSRTALLHNMFRDTIKQAKSKVILIYCPNCGTIIGTAGKDNV